MRSGAWYNGGGNKTDGRPRAGIAPDSLRRKGEIMKKIFTVIILCTIVFVIIFLFIMSVFKPVNLDFADIVTVKYEYGGKSIYMEIIDIDEVVRLKAICKGTVINDFAIPACGFGTVELTFEGKSKHVVLYPACDSCDTMRFGEENQFFYSIGEDERQELEEILEKYGATFPCV